MTIKERNVTARPDGGADVREGRRLHTWTAEQVKQAKALSDLCLEAGRWDCDCGCCVATRALAG